MTTERPEITVEGSDDGVTWKPYRFRWKPVRARPPAAVHHAAHAPARLADVVRRARPATAGRAPWFLRFEQRLLEGSPAVLALLRENPFPDRPPRYLRARLSLYTFTRWGSRDWWASEDVGLFCPPIGLPASEPAPSGDPVYGTLALQSIERLFDNSSRRIEPGPEESAPI